MDRGNHTVCEPARPNVGGLVRPPGPQILTNAALGGGQTPWHDDLLGDTWSWPADDDVDESATIAEIEALVGELVAQLQG
jgi:hypothetical protein